MTESKSSSRILPETSVIVPVYNRPEYLEFCINSILSGTYRDFEIIIVDDGSDEDTLKVCEEIKNKNERIRLISKAHGGVSSARNEGLRQARGEFVSFIDSDDMVEPEYLRTLTDAIKCENIDYALCGFLCEEDYEGRKEGEKFGYFSGDKTFYGNGVLTEACLLTQKGCAFKLSTSCMSLYRRSIIEEHDIRFREDIEYGEDTLFVFTYLHFIRGAKYIDRPLYIYIQHKDSASHSQKPMDFVRINLDFLDAIYEKAAECGDHERNCYAQFETLAYFHIVREILKGSDRTDLMEALELTSMRFSERCKIPVRRIDIARSSKLILWLTKHNHCKTVLALNDIWYSNLMNPVRSAYEHRGRKAREKGRNGK